MIRAVRIVGTATVLAALARLSQQLSEAWGQGTVEGYSVALGVVSLLFLVRALVSEFASDRVSIVQRDILWGLSLGAAISMVARLSG
jgi:Na+/H+-translocating membrane pyrophosphatase